MQGSTRGACQRGAVRVGQKTVMGALAAFLTQTTLRALN